MTVSIDGILLPEDIQWIDEFTGFGVGQVITPTLTGALLVEETTQPAGRQITLATGPDVWVRKSVVLQLETLVAAPLASDTSLPLVWGDGRTFDVVFDRSRGPGMRAVEMKRLAAGVQTNDHWYTIELNLLTV
jgi:hypothetical protein